MKTTNKKMLAIIMFLLLIIILLITYIYKNNLINKPQKVIKTKEEKITFTNQEIQKYIDYLVPFHIDTYNLLYNKDKIIANNLTAKEKIELSGSRVYDLTIQAPNNEFDYIREKDLKELIEEIYGPNTYAKTSFKLYCKDYILEDNKNYYSRIGCGGDNDLFSANTIISYKATKTKLEINTTYAFFNRNNKKIYKDFNGTAIDDLEFNVNQNNEGKMHEYIKNNQNKLNKITYTFISDDGKNYYFEKLINNKS